MLGSSAASQRSQLNQFFPLQQAAAKVLLFVLLILWGKKKKKTKCQKDRGVSRAAVPNVTCRVPGLQQHPPPVHAARAGSLPFALQDLVVTGKLYFLSGHPN